MESTSRRVLVAVVVLATVTTPAVAGTASPGLDTGPALALDGTAAESGGAISEAPSVSVEPAPEPAAQRQASPEFVDVVVRFESERARDPATVRSVGGTVTGGETVDLVPVLFARLPEPAVPALRNASGVASVERDEPVLSVVGVRGGETSPVPTATGSRATAVEGGSLLTTATETTWGYRRIEAGAARDAVGASAQSKVDVAIVDTGVDTDHPQLADQLGWGADTTGSETTYGLETAEDTDGHGTFVTGIVAAAADGSTPVGVAPNVEIYAVKVIEDDTGTISDLVEGIDAAVKGPDQTLGTGDDAEVLSVSIGGSSGSDALREAVNTASDRAVVVAAAGNAGDGDVETDDVQYPARYDGAVAVAATRRDDTTPTFSSEGPAVELAAPGVDLTSTTVGGGTSTGTGTSYAAPFVAGTAALVFAEDLADGSRDRSASGVRTVLQGAVVDIEADGRDRRSGYGLIQADEAVGAGDGSSDGGGGGGDDGDSGDGGSEDEEAVADVGIELERPSEGATVTGETTIRAVVDDPDPGRPAVEVSIDNGAWFSMTFEGGSKYTYSWLTQRYDDGEISVRVRAREAGDVATDGVTVTVNNAGPPAASIQSPAAGGRIEGDVEVVVAASDVQTPRSELRVTVGLGDGPERRATYVPDRGFVATVNATGEPGNRTLTARVTDGDGQTTTTAVTVVVDEDDPPVVTFLEPRAGESVTGSLGVSASVVDDRTDRENLTVEYRVGDGRWRPLEFDAARGVFVGERSSYLLGSGNRTVSVRATAGGNTTVENVTVDVANDRLASRNLSVEASDASVRPGGRGVVTVTVTPRESVSPLRAVVGGVPDGWRVTSSGSALTVWQSDERTVYWLGGAAANETVTADLTFAVPANASEGVTLTVVGLAGDELRTGTTATVTVRTGSESVVETIVGDDGTQYEEVLRAITLYNNGEAVPGTGGQTVGYGDVIEIIERFRSGRD